MKVTGVRCGSPALKGEQFCYFHQNAIRSVRRPKQSRLHPIALIEDEESIQYALMEVINALMKNTIDLKRATLILRALHIAVKNASRVKFGIQGRNAVNQVPEFAPPPDNADFDETTEIDLPYNAWVPQKSERQIMEEKHRAQKLHDWQAQIRANLERVSITRREPRNGEATNSAPTESHVGTAAPGCPGREATANVGADATVRPATLSEAKGSVPAAESPATANPATIPNPIPPHNFKPSQPTPSSPPPASHGAASTRKPPQAAATTPKQRKNAAHSGRHG